MATKKIQIEFDLNTNEVKLAGEATMSLAQQVRVLQKELSKTPEGTKEFELLRRKLNDTKDNFDRVNAKSRELFGTLSLLPGPVGDIAGKLNGAISLMKTFSGFSFKDLGNQFKGLIDDVKGILANLGSWGESTQEISNDLKGLNSSTESFNNTLANTVSNVGAAGDSVVNYGDNLKEQIELQKEAAIQTGQAIVKNNEQIASNLNNVKSIEDLNNMTDEQLNSTVALIDENEVLTTQLGDQITTVEQLEIQQQGAVGATNQQVAANKALTTSSAVATTSLRVLKGVLASLGIGLLIMAITTLVSKVVDWASSTKKADEANEALGETISTLNRILEDNLALVDEEVQSNILRAKAAGKTQKEIQDIERQGFKDRLVILKKGIKDLENEEFSPNFLRLTKDQQKERSEQILNERNKLNKQIIQIESQQRIFELKVVADGEEEKRKKRKEYSEKYISDKQKEKDKLKAQLDAQIQLEIDLENTRLTELERLLEERFLLEEGSASELELLFRNNQKKVQDAINDDIEKKRQKKLEEIQALIDIEQSQADINTEKLIELLSRRRDIEIQELELTEEQKLAIISKYESDFRKIRQDAREKQLVEDIQKNKGNFDEQIRLYREFSNEVVKSETYTAGEKLRILEETNQKIQQLEQERFENEKTKLDLKLQGDRTTWSEYYNELDMMYQNEIQRYQDLYDKKEITEAEYNQNIKRLSEARMDIRQKEVQAEMMTFQAIAQGLGAISQMVGEDTKKGKALAVAASLINTYAAIAGQLKAFGTLPIPGYAIAQAVATGLVGFAQVRKIIATPVPQVSTSQAQFSSGMINVNQRRAQGGFITGPGGETSDSVPAMLSNGEFVINSRSTRVFRPLLETINSASNLPQFAAGGLVRESKGSIPFKSQNETIAEAINTAFGQTPIKTYVTATDVSTQQQFERVIKSRSLI